MRGHRSTCSGASRLGRRCSQPAQRPQERKGREMGARGPLRRGVGAGTHLTGNSDITRARTRYTPFSGAGWPGPAARCAAKPSSALSSSAGIGASCAPTGASAAASLPDSKSGMGAGAGQGLVLADPTAAGPIEITPFDQWQACQGPGHNSGGGCRARPCRRKVAARVSLRRRVLRHEGALAVRVFASRHTHLPAPRPGHFRGRRGRRSRRGTGGPRAFRLFSKRGLYVPSSPGRVGKDPPRIQPLGSQRGSKRPPGAELARTLPAQCASYSARSFSTAEAAVVSPGCPPAPLARHSFRIPHPAILRRACLDGRARTSVRYSRLSLLEATTEILISSPSSMYKSLLSQGAARFDIQVSSSVQEGQILGPRSRSALQSTNTLSTVICITV